MRAVMKVILLAVLAVPVQAQGDAILQVASPWLRATLPGQQVSSGYFQLHNPTAEAVVVVAVRSARAAKIEMHQHLHENGMMRMRRLDSVLIPGGESVLFEPGGFHLMLFGLDAALTDGESVDLVLVLADGREQTVHAAVRALRR